MSTSRSWNAALAALLIGAAGWTWWSRGPGEVRSLLATAEEQLARRDYQAAVRTLDEAPDDVRADARLQVLRARAYAHARETIGGRVGASDAADATALQGFRILIYPLAGNREEEARAQALERKLVALVPADVEIRPHTRELLKEIGSPLADELRYDTGMMLDERAARALKGILHDAALGEFKLRHGRDRGAGTLYILFGGTGTRQTSD